MIEPPPRILATGTSGFIGRELLKEARRIGLRATGVARTDSGVDSFSRKADLTVRSEIDQVVGEVQPDVVFHLATQSASHTATAETAEADVLMLDNLMAALAEHELKPLVIIPGSAAEYGEAGPKTITEDTDLRPVSTYGRIKAGLEDRALTSPFSVVWLRNFNLLGPGQPPGHPVSDWVEQIVACELAGGGTLRTGRLDVVRDFLDVRDAATAYIAAASTGEPMIANVCSGSAARLADLVHALVGLARVDVDLVADATPSDSVPSRIVGDPARLMNLTGWTPQISLEQSLRDALEWARSRALVAG